MQKHIKVYLEYYGIEQEQVICEACGKKGVDIHHIQQRSFYGKKTKHLQDKIENLIGLCRLCHQKAHFQKEPYLHKGELKEYHLKNLK